MENYKQLWQIEAEASRHLTTELNVLAEKYNEMLKTNTTLIFNLETAKKKLKEVDKLEKEKDKLLKEFLGDIEYFKFFSTKLC